MIPKQLWDEEFRFCLIRNQSKAPFEKEWQKKSYKFNDTILLNHLVKGGNYGVIGGYGNLIILDKDNDKLNIDLDTFTIETGSGGRHYYFISDYKNNHVFIDELGELRSNNYQVVGSGSTHPNGNKYKVLKDIPLKIINTEELKKIIKPYLKTEVSDSTKPTKSDPTRSASEYRKVLSLVRKGKSKQDVFKAMEVYAKWDKSPPQYKELTYQKALNYIRKIQNTEEDREGFLFSEFGQFTNFLASVKKFVEVQPVYYDSHRIWWLWNHIDKMWKIVDEVDLINAIDDHTTNPSTKSNIKVEIIESLKRIGRRNKPLDASPTWIQFKDKIYDLKTDEIFDATPEYFITNPIPWKLGSKVETPIMDRIFEEWVVKEGVQDKSYIKTLYEFMAYCLIPSMPIHRIFCLIGDGLNGKGSFLRLIEKLVGDNNKCATEIETLAQNHFETAKLYKKLVCIIGEIDKGVFRKTKTMKSLSGNDLIRFEFKGKDGFDGHNYAKPLVATNHLPETTDKTKGFYRRWSIVDFPNIFSEKKDILNDIPDEEYENFCNKSIQILKNLLKNGEFTNDGTIQEREDKYEKHSNRINEFIHLYCDKDKDSYIEFNDFCEKYNDFLHSEGFFKKSKIEIGRAIILKGYQKRVKKVDFTTKMAILGIKIKEGYV